MIPCTVPGDKQLKAWARSTSACSRVQVRASFVASYSCGVASHYRKPSPGCIRRCYSGTRTRPGTARYRDIYRVGASQCISRCIAGADKHRGTSRNTHLTWDRQLGLLLLAADDSFLPKNLLRLLSNNTQLRALRHIRKVLSFPAGTQ